MIGTLFNTCMILVGSIVGSLLKKGLKETQQRILFDAMGLSALGIGINSIVNHMPDSQYPVLFIVSLAVGSIIGTGLDIDAKFQHIVDARGGSGLGQGLSTAILLFCIGTLSILGPMQSALYGDETFLFTNGTLDLVTSMVLASTYGIGIAFACDIEVNLEEGYAATYNDSAMIDLVESSATAELGESAVRYITQPFSGSEDFSFFGKLTGTPCAFMMIDAGHGENPVSLHNGKIVFDENVMRSGVAGMSAVALKYLAE